MRFGVSDPDSRCWNLFEGELEVLKSFNQASVYLLFLFIKDDFVCCAKDRSQRSWKMNNVMHDGD